MIQVPELFTLVSHQDDQTLNFLETTPLIFPGRKLLVVTGMKLKPEHRNYFYILLGALGMVVFSFIAAPFVPPGRDWSIAFRPAAWEMIYLRSPFNVPGFFNPPWTAVALIPFAIFPEQVGRVLMILTGLIAYAYVGYKLGGSRPAILAVLLSPLVMHTMLNGNMDWLSLLGLVMPPQIGLFFVTMKPQLGIAVVIYWLVESWWTGGYKRTIQVFWPITLVTLLSFLLYGFWPWRARVEVDLWWNTSLWPMSLPVGLALMVAALRKWDIRYAMGASPCFAPYILFHSWVIALYAIIRSTPETIAAVIGLWVLVAIRFFGF